MLSGFNFNRFDMIMMNIITPPSNRLADEAVLTLVPTITWIILEFLDERFNFIKKVH